MTSDLERMLRASLQERADDVEPTPELWRQVDRRISRRRALPLFVWTAAGLAAVVAAVVVVPGLLDRVEDGLVIDPAESPSRLESPTEDAPGPVAAAPLTHYVAVVDGRLVLRGVDGSEEELWRSEEGAALRLAVRPGSTLDRFTVATVASIEGMLDLAVVTRTSGETSTTQTFVANDTDDGSTTPTLAWNPDGSTVATLVAAEGRAELTLFDTDGTAPEGGTPQQRIALAGVEDPSQLRLQDWASDGDGGSVWFTSRGELYRAPIAEVGGRWDLGVLERMDGDDYVVDVANHPDGRLYRLLAGAGAGSGDAEAPGLGLFLDEEPLGYPDLPTADPSGVWMTAVDGGVFVGLGDDARRVHVGEGRHEMLAVPGVTYAAWIPVAGDGEAVPHGDPTESFSDDTPDRSGSGSGPYPYVAIDPEGRVAVHTGDGGEREVILDEQLWHPEAGVRALDVSVRPGSSAGEVSGVVLLATEGGPELAWFRTAAGETVIRPMEGPFGLGPAADDPRDAPTFSPDGRHLAWVEPDGADGWTLRTVGMADDGPTDEDAGFGLDIPAQRLRLTGWEWDDGTGGTATGGLFLVNAASPGGEGFMVRIERQGDGALATDGPLARLGFVGELTDVGLWEGMPRYVTRTPDGWFLVLEDGQEVAVPLAAETEPRDIDLDLFARSSVVTDRRTGQAYIVDTAGNIEPLGTVAHGFDPVR